MRPLLALLLVLLAAGTSLPWWGGGMRAPAGAVVIAVGAAVTLDPLQASSLEEFRLLDALFEGLLRLDPATLAPTPALASAWSASADGRTWTFTLGRRTWSDGSPVTAEQMADGLRRHLAGSAASALLAGVNAVEARDDTVLVTTASAMPWLPAVLATPVFIPWHPAMAAPGAWTDAERLVTNGPLRCRRAAPHHLLDLEPAPWYRGPLVARGPVRLLVVDDAGAAVRLYLDGRVDAALRLNADTVGDLVRAGRGDLRRAASWGTELYRVRMTPGGGRPDIPPAVRRALSAVIDRGAIVHELLRGNGVPATGLVPPSAAMLGYPTAAIPAAVEPLPACGPLELVVPANQPERLRIAEWLVDEWKRRLGLEVRLTAVPTNQAAARAKGLDYDLVRGSIVGDYPDPGYFLACFRSGAGMNRTGFADRDYDRLLEQAAADPPRRLELLARAEARLLDEAVIIPLYHYLCAFLVRPGITGIDANALELVHLAAVGRSGD